MLQLKNYALTRRESSQGANDAFAQFAADRASLGAGACPVIGHVVQHFFFLALGRNGCGQIAAARIFLAQVIKAKISHNAVDPRVERTFEAETSQVDVGAEECLLVHVLAILLRTGEMNRETQHGTIVLPDQFLERFIVALLCRPYQCEFFTEGLAYIRLDGTHS